MRQTPPPDKIEFEFRLDRLGEIGFTLGNARLSISVDAAYELQYQLAEMLAFIETFEDRAEEFHAEECVAACEKHSNIIPFDNLRRNRP